MNLITIFLLAISLLTDPAGLKVGQKAPDFTGTDQNGNRISLYESLKSHKVILTFYRGAWCKYCMGQFKDYQDSITYFNNNGAMLMAVSPEHEEGIQKTAKISNASFSLIHDDGLEIMHSFEVISTERVKEYQEGKEASGEDNQHKFLPVPATYVINQNGFIEYVFFDPNYKNRVTVKSLLRYL